MAKKIVKTNLVAALCVVVAVLGYGLIGQAGNLEPSAPPAPTMKTLDEVEPRIPISSVPYTISQSGSYYLTGNFQVSDPNFNGITINSSNVTIDMSGYTLSGPFSGTGHGIYINGTDNIEIRNGTITAFGADGINSGVFGGNIYRIIGLRVKSNIGAGINLTGRLHLVTDCFVQNNNEDGIRVHSESRVVNNTCDTNGNGQIQDGAGIHVTLSGNLIEGNQVLGNRRGLDVDVSGNIIRNNVVKASTTNYDIVSGNQLSILLCEIPETISVPALVELAGNLSTSDTSANGITIETDNVTIDLKGFELVGPGSGTGHGVHLRRRSNVEVKNGTIRNFGGNGIAEDDVLYYDARNNRVINVRAIDNDQRGISLYSQNNLVKDCTVNSNDGGGIWVGSGSTLTGNTCSDNGGRGISTVDGSTIIGNTCSSNTFYGIGARGECTIINNTCFDNSDNGINAGWGSTVKDNACNNNATYGIKTTSGGATITGNTCHSNPSGGIYAGGADNVIKNNSCSSNGGYGINTGTGSTVAYNACTNNSTGGISSVDGCTVEGNSCRDNSGHGINAGAGNTITGNTCSVNTTTGIDAGAGNTIIGNTCYENSVSGINTGNGNTITDNTCYLNSLFGIYSLAGSTVSGNTCYENSATGIYSGPGSRFCGNIAYKNATGISASLGSTVTENAARDNQNWGIYLSGDNLVDQNTATNNNLSGGAYGNMNTPGSCVFGDNKY